MTIMVKLRSMRMNEKFQKNFSKFERAYMWKEKITFFES